MLILAAAILGAAWILKPEPVKQISQAELASPEEIEPAILRLAKEVRPECGAQLEGRKGRGGESRATQEPV